MAGKADKKCNMIDLIYFKKAFILIGAPVTYFLPHHLHVDKPWFPDKPVKFTLQTRLNPFLIRANVFIHRFPNHHIHQRLGKFGLGKAIFLYIAKMPFALSLCRRCSYSFTTSSNPSKDTAIVISQYNRTTRKQCSHIQEDLRFGPHIANLIPLSYKIFYSSQEKTAAKSLVFKN
jgi:hypothetical protein